jgi:predicted DNA-binding transcriptional regulator YafY
LLQRAFLIFVLIKKQTGMAYTRNSLEIHSMIARLYEKYGDRGFISFRKTPEVKGTQYLEPIIKAIEDKQVLRLYYLPFYEDKPYFNEVHPYLLREHGFRWYLVGLNDFRDQIRTYALDRIRDLQRSTGTAYRDHDFDASSYFKYAVGIIAPPGEPPLIKLSVQKTQAQYLITQPWHESQNILEETREQVVFSFRVHPTYEFKSLVLSLGRDALVLEPDALKQEMKRELELMLDTYIGGTGPC